MPDDTNPQPPPNTGPAPAMTCPPPYGTVCGCCGQILQLPPGSGDGGSNTLPTGSGS